MQFNFQEIINQLNGEVDAAGNFAFSIARARVVPNDYLFNAVLPNRPMPTYYVSGGSIRIYPTMAGLVPMDTPYPPIGAMESSTFFEKVAKYAGTMHFPEKVLRQLQEWGNAMAGARVGGSFAGLNEQVNTELAQRMLGFAETLLKSQWDRYEYLKGEVLTEGAIDWQYGENDLTVDYGIPAANIRNNTSTDSYYNTASKFWTDIRFITTKLRNPVIMMNNNTWLSIINNPVNNITVVVNEGNVREIVKATPAEIVGTQIVPTARDARDRARIIIYDKSGTLIDDAGTLVTKAFLKDGRIVVVGEQTPDGFELLEGSTSDPTRAWELGYTHLAPTVEGGSSAFWQRIYTPQGKPYQVIGETASNGLPVVINPNRLIILKTAMPS